jgi:EmrB/QacA subfamily drug resistance transporter
MESFPASHEGDTPSLEDDPALGLSQRAKLEVLFAVMLGLFLGALDQTIVGPALPTIVSQLSGNDYYVWAVTIYLLTSTITVPFWGKGSDLYGRKPVFMLGIVVFLIGSALSGLSQNMAMLILFRGIQGIGAGALFPVALAIIGDLFTPAERGKYQGLFGAVFGVAFVAGPLIGGWLTENASWHWIFYVNIPIGIIALLVIQRLLPTVKTASATRNFDIVGGLIFTVSMIFLLVGLTNKGLNDPTTGALNDWTAPTVGGFILIGIVGTLLFIFAESRAKEPIVPLDLWRRRTYSASMVSTFFAAFAFFGAIVFLPRWFQVVEGFSPTNSGLAALPLVVGLIGSSIASGILVARTGRYKAILVVAIAVLGVATALMTQLTKDTPLPILWAWMFLAGLGVGPTFSVFTIVIQNAVPFRQLGVATSNLTFFRQIGGTVALAFVGTIFATTFQQDLVPQLAASGVPQPLIDQFSAGGGSFDTGSLTGVGDMGAAILASIPQQARAFVEPYIPNIVEGIHGAFSLAVGQTFWLGVFGAVVGVLAALAIKEIPLRHSNEAPVPTRAIDDAAATAPAGAAAASSTPTSASSAPSSPSSPSGATPATKPARQTD